MASWLTGMKSKKENKKEAKDLQYAAAERGDLESQRKESYLPGGMPSNVPNAPWTGTARTESSLPDERAADIQKEISGIQSRAAAGLAPTEYEEHIMRANGATDEDINKLQNKGRVVKDANGNYTMTEEAKQRQSEANKIENDVKENGLLNSTSTINPDKMERNIAEPNNNVIEQPTTTRSAQPVNNNDLSTAPALNNETAGTESAGTESDNKADQGIINNDPQMVQEAADDKAESVADKLSDKRSKQDVHAITRNIFDAYANGEFGEPGTNDAKMARNYFIMNELLTASKNWTKRDEHYIHNLQTIVTGGVGTDYDSSNDEKSRWQQMRDKAMERYNAGQDILAKSDYETAANIGTQEQNAEAAQNMGTQGLANAAALNQVSQGNFDAMTQAFATGDPNKISEALNANIDKEITSGDLAKLGLESAKLDYEFDKQSFDSRLQGLIANNSMTAAQAQLLMKKVDALGGIESAMKNLANGKISLDTLKNAGLSVGELGILKVLGGL